MAANSNVPELNSIKILFIEVQPKLPCVNEDGVFETYQFIEAVRSFIMFYELLGSTFYVVKKDMLGNVEKLTKVFNKCPEKYKFINDMIAGEKADPRVFAIESLLWLKRALEFTSCFIRSIIEEWKAGCKSDSVTHLVVESYEKILKPHHNWLVQNIFKMVLKAFPSRKELLKIFCYGEEHPEAVVMEAADVYIKSLESNLDVLNRLFTEGDLEKLVMNKNA